MSRGPAAETRSHERVNVASTAVAVGTAQLGDGALLAQGAVLRSENLHLTIGAGSAVLENPVVVGTGEIPTRDQPPPAADRER